MTRKNADHRLDGSGIIKKLEKGVVKVGEDALMLVRQA